MWIPGKLQPFETKKSIKELPLQIPDTPRRYGKFILHKQKSQSFCWKKSETNHIINVIQQTNLWNRCQPSPSQNLSSFQSAQMTVISKPELRATFGRIPYTKPPFGGDYKAVWSSNPSPQTLRSFFLASESNARVTNCQSFRPRSTWPQMQVGATRVGIFSYHYGFLQRDGGGWECWHICISISMSISISVYIYMCIRSSSYWLPFTLHKFSEWKEKQTIFAETVLEFVMVALTHVVCRKNGGIFPEQGRKEVSVL